MIQTQIQDRTYPKAYAYIRIEGVIGVKQMLWAATDRAIMIWKQPRSFTVGKEYIALTKKIRLLCNISYSSVMKHR